MKLAHLILVHSNYAQTERLINRLSHVDADVYIHLDAKVDINNFINLGSFRQVYFIKNRVSVEWGNYSMIDATLKAFEEIIATGISYSHINLLSGQDYPLKNAEEIHKFLFSNPDKTFMRYLAIPEEWDEPIERLEKYNFGDFKFRGRHILQEIVNKIFPRKKTPTNLKIFGRSQWLTITPKCASYVIDYLKENTKVRHFFMRTWAADELIFQTILLNSDLKDSIVNNHLRYIKFKRGDSRPTTLTEDDEAVLLGSGKFYARKFDLLKHSEILLLLDKAAEAELLDNNFSDI